MGLYWGYSKREVRAVPKINVYLPDELAEAVKEAGVPVSAVCQRALEQAVRRMHRHPGDRVDRTRPRGAWTRALIRLTDRTRPCSSWRSIGAGAAAAVGTGHLLAGMLDEGGNLALHVLRAMDIEPGQVGRDLARQTPAPPRAGESRTGAALQRRRGQRAGVRRHGVHLARAQLRRLRAPPARPGRRARRDRRAGPARARRRPPADQTRRGGGPGGVRPPARPGPETGPTGGRGESGGHGPAPGLRGARSAPASPGAHHAPGRACRPRPRRLRGPS